LVNGKEEIVMSKPPVESEIFKDEKGYLCAVRKDRFTEAEAREIAKERLINDEVSLTEDYSYMYHGFGKTVGMDEYENTWWITDTMTKNAVPVYVFREWD
jgi:hypothetical protein